jgi:hypothetical protein
MLNDFRKDLEFSHNAEDLELWRTIYDKAFPGNHGYTNMRDNGQTQYLGIDRTVILSSGKAIYIDEKVRRKDYGDILIEYISNDIKKTKGWGEKPLFCDYIAYAILPKNICYLLPVPQLQKAWSENKPGWLSQYGTRSADNKYYKTLNCPVPINDLFKAIGQTLRIKF